MKKDLFEDTKPSVIEDIQLPLYYKNKKGNVYTCLHEDEKFEQLTISEENMSFRGSIIFGFNEQLKLFKGDISLLLHSIKANQVIIEASEYDAIFTSIQEGRQEFFTENKHEYIEPVQHLTQDQLNKYIKHRWKPLQ